MTERYSRTRRGIGRRDLIKGVLAAGLGAVPVAAAAEEMDKITEADLACADRVAGVSYTEAERRLMVNQANALRAGRHALLAAAEDPTLEPAFHFDPRLPGSSYSTRSRAEFHPASGPFPHYNGDPSSVAFAPVTCLSHLIRTRKLTSTALTRLYLERLKKFGPRLNCVVTLTEELGLKQAAQADAEIAAGHYRGPLHGIPWGAKDLLATRGIRTTWGARPYESQIFDYDATVTRRLAEAGAVLVAKLSLGELAQGDVWFGGQTRNPWDSRRGSSGSSAGPCSAVAAGLVAFAIGSETLGSIVSPSVENGVTGLRPTYGRVSRYGAMALCWTMDKLGPISRGVEDCASILHAIHGPDGLDGSATDLPFSWNAAAPLNALRAGYDAQAFAAIAHNSGRAKIYADALQVLRDLGVELKPITLPRDGNLYGQIADLIITCESATAFAALTASGRLDQLAGQDENGWPTTFRLGSIVPAPDYLQAMRLRTRLQREMAQAMQGVDLYVTVPFRSPSLVYTNLTGHPTLVTRCGLVDGLPQSIEFTGGLYQEEAILRLALAYERATAWHMQWPDPEKLPVIPPSVDEKQG